MDGKPQDIAAVHYWGKTRPAWHLLPCHCLDVAATGREYLLRHHRLRRCLAAALGLPEPVFLAWFTFFLALHDLGKFAQSFQARRTDVLLRLQPGLGAPTKTSPERHDSLGYGFWNEHLRPRLRNGDWLKLSPETPRNRVVPGLDHWAAAVTGHHGLPPKQSPGSLVDAFADADRQAALAFVDEVASLLLGELEPVVIADAEAFRVASKRLSWWLAGIAVLADWLGSNTRWFDFCDDPGLKLARYWPRACRQAAAAVSESGVLPVASAASRAFGELFPSIPPAGASPLQQLAAELDLATGPQLFVLEDVTGAGKTEAALLLAHRLMAADRADGLYFALPTMATAGAMYARLGEVYGRLFASGTRPSIVLAHGMRDLDPRFRQSLLSPGAPEDDYADAGAEGPEAAGLRCNAWLADSRKKALLAQVGAGTLDQGLLGILQARHQSLRLLGLFGKVLVCDEVHASDPYVHELLCILLHFHAAAGGSAILLSATLPTKMRAGLLEAWARGRGDAPMRPCQHAYPLLTQAGVAELPVATRPDVARQVRVCRLDSIDAVLDLLLRAAEAGHCACWIRNTVGDACAAHALLAAAMAGRGQPAESLTLFHARFTVADRQRIETDVVARFGRNGDPAGRRGRIVIGSQVLEQSLDVDFDVLVSDLAPIDALIQRAGRMCRHRRDASGAVRTDDDPRPDARVPCLWVHGPAPVADAGADWYRAMFRGAAAVYPNHRQLWLTAAELERRGGFAMPDDARALIETVFGDDAEAPAALDRSDINTDGERHAATAMAQFNALQLDAGYQRSGSQWADDSVTPTRLGDAETVLRLAVYVDGDWRPLHDEAQGWERSQVRLRQRHARRRAPLSDPMLEAAAVSAESRLPDRGKWSVLLPLFPDGEACWRATVLDANDQPCTLRYGPRFGLLREQEQNVSKESCP